MAFHTRVGGSLLDYSTNEAHNRDRKNKLLKPTTKGQTQKKSLIVLTIYIYFKIEYTKYTM